MPIITQDCVINTVKSVFVLPTQLPWQHLVSTVSFKKSYFHVKFCNLSYIRVIFLFDAALAHTQNNEKIFVTDIPARVQTSTEWKNSG
jgi:hypothetical protein